MIHEVTSQRKEKKVYKVFLILLIGLTSISGVRKDLNALVSFASEVHSFTNAWLSVLPVNQAPEAIPGVCQLEERKVFVPVSTESPLRQRVVNERSIQIKTLKRDLRANNGRITISLPANLDIRFSNEVLYGANVPEFPADTSAYKVKAFEYYDWPTQPSLADGH